MPYSDDEIPAAVNEHLGKEMDKTLTKEETETESAIQYFLEAYKNYLVQCIDYKDLLFYKYFDPGRRKEFRDLARHQDGESITSIMIDSILSMHDVPDRFSVLLQLFEEEFENEKVLRILKGEKAPSNRLENKERIQRVCMREICENLQMSDIIPKLYENKLILHREMESLLKRARHTADFEAAVDLLLILPSRHCNWYAIFMYCLIDTDHDKLAERVDRDLYQISGTMPAFTCRKSNFTLKLNRGMESTPQDNRSDAKDNDDRVEEKSTTGSDTMPRKTSPSDERVAHWIMSRNNAITKEGVRECTFSKNRRHLNLSRRKRFSGRTSSLLEKSTSQTGSDFTLSRYTTMHVPLNKVSDKQTNVNLSCDSLWSDENDENRSSDISSMDSLSVVSPRSMSNLHLELNPSVNVPTVAPFSKTADVTIETKDRNEEKDCQRGIGRTDLDVTRSKRQYYFPMLELLFAVRNLHPVKILLILKGHPKLYDAVNLLSWMSNRTIFYDDMISSLKYHYIGTVIQQAKLAGNIDDWMHKLLTGRESDGFYEFQDQLVRNAVDGFPHKESSFVKNILTQLNMSPLGDGLTSLKILIQSLNEDSMSAEEQWISSSNGYALVGIPSQRNRRLCTCSNESFNTLKAYVSDSEVTPNDPLYQSMMNWIAKVCSRKCYYDRIIGIKRVKNKSMLEKYKQETERMANGTPENLNQRFLFCSSEFLTTVIKGELNDLTCQNDVYLAEDPILVDESCNFGTSSCSKCSGCERYMLLCRVCLENVHKTCSDDLANKSYSFEVRHNERCLRNTLYRVNYANQGPVVFKFTLRLLRYNGIKKSDTLSIWWGIRPTELLERKKNVEYLQTKLTNIRQWLAEH